MTGFVLGVMIGVANGSFFRMPSGILNPEIAPVEMLVGVT